jgi:hypothetical protein
MVWRQLGMSRAGAFVIDTKPRTTRRDTPENDRKLDSSDLSINGLLSATCHRLSSMTAQASSLQDRQARGNPDMDGALSFQKTRLPLDCHGPSALAMTEV